MILDTNVLIDLIKNQKPAVQCLEKLREEGTSFSVTTISVFELFRGLRKTQNDEKIGQLQSLVNSFVVYSFSIQSAQEGGLMLANLEKKGVPIDTEDCMIAGVAKTRNEPILTRNKKHFERISGIKVQSY
jgi:predicted nucleic acid-binding protein